MSNQKIFKDPLINDNPITRQVLGICSALAVTVNLQQAAVMSIAVTFVLCSSNVVVSTFRDGSCELRATTKRKMVIIIFFALSKSQSENNSILFSVFVRQFMFFR